MSGGVSQVHACLDERSSATSLSEHRDVCRGRSGDTALAAALHRIATLTNNVICDYYRPRLSLGAIVTGPKNGLAAIRIDGAICCHFLLTASSFGSLLCVTRSAGGLLSLCATPPHK